jgi:hypothetical protein
MIVLVLEDDPFGLRNPGRSCTYPMIFAARAISRSNRFSIAMASVMKDDYHTAGCAVEILLYAFGELCARRVVPIRRVGNSCAGGVAPTLQY